MDKKEELLDSYTDDEMDLFGEVIGYLINGNNDIKSFNNIEKAYRKLKDFLLRNCESNKKELLLNQTFVEKTLKNFVGNLDGEEHLDCKVENLLGLYSDRLEGKEIDEEIIKYELYLPENGNRDNWMNLIDGIIELSDGKTDKFINESNKVLKLYNKKEK